MICNSLTNAHIRMQRPRPLNGDIDNNKNPLGPGNPFPCQGHIATQPRDTAEQYVQGGDASIRLTGTATHGGGSCQISLSYDNGSNFRVIESIVGGCPLSEELNFKIPSTVPVGKALLGWTGFNKNGSYFQLYTVNG